jgi:hypothetical protein
LVEEKNSLVRQKKTLKLSQSFSGVKDASVFLPIEVDIYHEWIAKEIERKLAKDAQIAKCRLVLRKEKSS